jgi:hypothetical protein
MDDREWWIAMLETTAPSYRIGYEGAANTPRDRSQLDDARRWRIAPRARWSLMLFSN